MKTLVIIVSYNFERWMDRCLGSLRQLKQPADVLVVDNASQDRTASLIREHYPEVRLICSPKNLGFGRANNIGMQIAIKEGYDFVFLLNQDAWIEPDTLCILTQLSERHPDHGIFSPLHLTGSGERLEQGFAGYTGLKSLEEIKNALPETGNNQAETGSSVKECSNHLKKNDNCETEIGNSRELVTVPFINAAFWLIPVRILKQVGGFCPLFNHYGEDVDYVNRLHYQGYRVGYSPLVRGCHDREHRPVSREAWLRSEEVYLLTEYVNIRRSLPAAFGYGVLAGIKKAWKQCLDHDQSTAMAYLRITARLLRRTPEVLHYRRQNRNRFLQALYLTDDFDYLNDNP